MNKENSLKALNVAAILFKHNVPISEAKEIASFIEELITENEHLKKLLQDYELKEDTQNENIQD